MVELVDVIRVGELTNWLRLNSKHVLIKELDSELLEPGNTSQRRRSYCCVYGETMAHKNCSVNHFLRPGGMLLDAELPIEKILLHAYCGRPAPLTITPLVASHGVKSSVVFCLTSSTLDLSGFCLDVNLSVYTDDIFIWTSAVTRPQVRARHQKAAIITPKYLCAPGLRISTEKCALVPFTHKLVL